MSYRQAWGEERVYYEDEAGQLRALPVGWTSLSGVDPFVAVSAGRSWFRVGELIELVRLVERLREEM